MSSAIALSTVIVSVLTAYTAEDVVRLEREAYEQRYSIRSGVIELEATTVRMNKEGATTQRDSHKKLFLDGTKRREDDERDYIRQPKQSSGKSYWSRNASTEQAHFSTTEDDSNGQQPLQAAISHPDLMKDPLLSRTTDLRAVGIGLADSGNLKQKEPAPFLSRSDVEIVTVKEEVVDGVPCVTAEFRRRDGATGLVRVAPDQGPGIVAFEIKDGVVEEKLSTRLTKDKSGLWFPSQARFRYLVNGRPTLDETVDVKVVSLDEPVDPAAFTFVGMGLEPGSLVTQRGFADTHELFWTGSELLPGSPSQSPVASPIWYWVLGGAAAIAGVALLFRSVARQR